MEPWDNSAAGTAHGGTHVAAEKGVLVFWDLPFLRGCHQSWDLIIVVFPHGEAIQRLISTLRETESYIKDLKTLRLEGDYTLQLYNSMALIQTLLRSHKQTRAYACVMDMEWKCSEKQRIPAERKRIQALGKHGGGTPRGQSVCTALAYSDAAKTNSLFTAVLSSCCPSPSVPTESVLL